MIEGEMIAIFSGIDVKGQQHRERESIRSLVFKEVRSDGKKMYDMMKHY